MGKASTDRIFHTLDFHDFLLTLGDQFTGREWIFESVRAWLANPQGERIFLLTGPPGAGKSALSARLVQTEPRVAAYHFCIAGRSATITPSTVLRSLAAYLGQHLTGYGLALANTLDPKRVRVDVKIDIGALSGGEVVGLVVENLIAPDAQTEAEILLQAPLAALPAPPQPALFVIDSLDEAVTWRGDVNLVTLFSNLGDLPPWVRFFCTTRPERRVLSYFPDAKIYPLDVLSGENQADLRRYVDMRTKQQALKKRLTAEGQAMPAFTRRVLELARGNFLYTRVLLDDVQAGRQPLENLDALPHSLDEIYHRFLRRFSDPEWQDRYQPLFGLLAAALEPLSEAQLAAFSGQPRTPLRQALGVLRQFLDHSLNEQGQESFSLFHQSLREYLTDEARNPDFWCAPEDGHQAIAGYFWEHFSDGWAALDAYGLRHLAAHLAGAKEASRLQELLLDYGWLEARLEKDGQIVLVRDYSLARSSLLRLPAQGAEAISLVESALRLSDYILAADPGQLPAQLWGRLLSETNPLVITLIDGLFKLAKNHWLCARKPGLTPPGPLLMTLDQDGSLAGPIALSPDGKLAGYAGQRGKLAVWDLDSAVPIERLMVENREEVLALHFTMDSSALILDCVGGVRYRFALDELRYERLEPLSIAAPEMWKVAAIAPDGSGSLERGPAGQLRLLGMDGTPAASFELPDQGVSYSLAYAPAAGLALVGTGKDEEEYKIWREDGRLYCIRLAGENKTTGDGLPAPDMITQIDAPGGPAKQLAITPDGKTAVSLHQEKLFSNYRTSGWSSPVRNYLAVWDLQTREKISTLYFPLQTYENIAQIAVSVDGRLVLTLSSRGRLQLWDLNRADRQTDFSSHSEGGAVVAVAPSGRKVFSAGDDGFLLCWDLETLKSDRWRGYRQPAMSLAVTPDERHAVIESFGCLQVWNLDPPGVGPVLGELPRSYAFEDQEIWIRCLSLLTDSQHAMIIDNHGTLKVWQIQNKEPEQKQMNLFGEVQYAAISQDGLWALVSADGYHFTLHDLSGKSPDRSLEIAAGVTQVALSGDGRLALFIDHHRQAWIWKIAADDLQRLPADQPFSIYAALTPSGEYAALVTRQNTLELWNVEAGVRLAGLTVDTEIVFCAISAGGGVLACYDSHGVVHICQFVEGVSQGSA
jgi:WD40 repeat protein